MDKKNRFKKKCTMIQNCKFNPMSDVEEVVPELAPDISEMMVTHTVPATSATDSPYSNVNDIKEVGHYLRDKIDIAMAQLRLNASLSEKANANATSSTTSTSSSE